MREVREVNRTELETEFDYKTLNKLKSREELNF